MIEENILGKKVFVSYKYKDNQVALLDHYNYLGLYSTVRNYVDYLQDNKFSGDDLNKAEDANEDLSHFTNETIKSHLRKKIWDSSITLVLISPGMQETLTPERDQWIPWEVAYSLKTETKQHNRSLPNGMIAVVLPDRNGQYAYFTSLITLVDDKGHDISCRMINTSNTFEIIGNNMFNQKLPDTDIIQGHKVYNGESSYILTVTWSDFINDVDRYLDRATNLKDNHIDEYALQKEPK